MATELVMPRLSDTMDSGTIAKWLKKVGDRVEKGEIVAEIETDKANMEMESYAAGILAKVIVGEGQSTGVGEPIGVVAASEDEVKEIQGQTPPTLAEGKQAAQQAAEPAQVPPEQAGPPAKPQIGQTEPNERIKASPLARRLAQEHGIDLEDVAGTGPAGRITKEDVQSFLQQVAPIGRTEQPATVVTERRPAHAPEKPSEAAEGLRGAERTEMTRMQQTIARRMAEAKATAPAFVLTAEFDMTEARDLLSSLSGVEGAPKVGPNDLLIKACAGALARHRDVNAGWEDGIVRYHRINIGFAVAVEGGLVVPVIKDADKKTLGEIAQETKDLIDKARHNKLAPGDYEGGTFTISNLGMFGIDQFTPIINIPEACIMGVGTIGPKPVVVDGEVVVRQRMRVTLSCDHRVIYGAEGAAFLQTVRRFLEHPLLAVL